MNSAAIPACTSSATYGVPPARMQGAERGRQKSIDAGDERQPRRRGEPAADAAERVDRHERGENRHHPRRADPRRHRLNRLHDALQARDLLLRHRQQHAEGADHVQRRHDRAGREDRARHGAPRVHDLLAHRRRAFDAAERERDRGPEDHVLERRARHEARAPASASPIRIATTRSRRTRSGSARAASPPARRRCSATCRRSIRRRSSRRRSSGRRGRRR